MTTAINFQPLLARVLPDAPCRIGIATDRFIIDGQTVIIWICQCGYYPHLQGFTTDEQQVLVREHMAVQKAENPR